MLRAQSDIEETYAHDHRPILRDPCECTDRLVRPAIAIRWNYVHQCTAFSHHRMLEELWMNVAYPVKNYQKSLSGLLNCLVMYCHNAGFPTMGVFRDFRV